MKTKFLNKAFALILTISILFTLASIVSFAETHVGGAESELFKLDNGDISTFKGFETSEHLSYVYYYKGTDPWCSKDFSNGVRPMKKSTNYDGKEAYIVGDVPGEDGTTATVDKSYARADGMYAPQYHLSPGLAFEAPSTGTFRFTIQYKIPNENHRIVVSKSSVQLSPGANYPGNLGIYGGTVGTVVEKVVDIDLTVGEKAEKAYFFVDNYQSNGYETQFHIKSVEQVVVVENTDTSWNYGSISTFTGFETGEHLSYVYYYQGTDNNNYATSAGVYPMTKSTNNYRLEAYIVGDVSKTDGSTATVTDNYARANGIYAPQYHFSPGLAFEAPLTGTLRFTIQYTIPNTNHRIVVAKSSVPLSDGENYTGNLGIYGGAAGTLVEEVIDIDLTKGEKAYFFVDNLNNGYETKFHIRSVEYVYGDLNANPVTFIAAQETAKKENGRFDVRLISALNSLEYKSVGYKFSIEVDGVMKVTDQSVAVNTVYGKLLKYGEGGAEEFQAPQNTNLVGGLFENLPTDKTVKITVYAYAETTEGTYYYDSGCVITYTNGVFTAMDNIA